VQTRPLVPLIERVAAAAEERQFSQNSVLAYRRTWLKILAWAEGEGLVLETFPVERVGEFFPTGPAAARTARGQSQLLWPPDLGSGERPLFTDCR
jgi:hypothetical protein